MTETKVPETNDAGPGWRPEEVAIDEPTRSSRWRWVVVVDGALSPGTAVNAAVCVAAHVGAAVRGLLGPDGSDAGGGSHPGLPWAGCTVLTATADELTELRRRAVAAGDVDVCDTPASAQTNRVYAEYLTELAGTDGDRLQLRALSLFGPKNRIGRLTGRLDLLP